MPTVTYSRITVRSQFTANTYISGNQLAPDVLGLSNGGYVVAYNNFDINNGWILLNFYDSAGTALGSFDIPYDGSGQTDAVGAASLTQLDNGNVLVVWADANASFPGIRGTIFTPAGTSVVHNFAITGFATDRLPQVSALEGGGFAVTYDTGGNILARVYNSAGAAVTSEFVVAATGVAETDPAITGLADGGFAVTWTNNNAGTIEIMSRIFNANGTARTSGFVVGGTGINTQSAVAALPNGNFAVAYRDDGWGDEDTGITLTIVSPTGTIVTAFTHVNTPGDPHNESDPDITVLANGFIVVTWTFPFNPGVDEDIYARVFDQAGNPVAINGTTAPFIIDASTSNDLFSAVSAIVSGQFIAGWQDSVTSDGDLGRISATVQEIVRVITGDGTNEALFGDNLLGDYINGMGGNDILTGDGGRDQLTGGTGNDVFQGFANGLNGDTIVDFTAGDRILIVDANPNAFSFSLSGNTLTYTGGSLTLTANPLGQIVSRAAAGGGVELVVVAALPRSGDFNGDGIEDVLLRHSSGIITNWLGQSNGSFVSNHAVAQYALGTDWTIETVGDFNGDSRDDVLLRHSSGVITNWLGQANGSFVSNHAVAQYALDNDWQVQGTGDFNGDGREDLLLRNSAGIITNWLAQPNGSFFSNHVAAQYALDNSWEIVGIGDFNGDGRDDVLLRNGSGIITNWLAQPNGSYVSNHAVAQFGLDNNWQIAGIGDFNGDGRDDVLLRHTNGIITDWLGQANGSFVSNHAVAQYALDPAWLVDSIGDYNGDGRDDILLRHSNGIITDWLGQPNGSFASNHTVAQYTLDNSWQVQPDPWL